MEDTEWVGWRWIVDVVNAGESLSGEEGDGP